jgi:hypothetical protein
MANVEQLSPVLVLAFELDAETYLLWHNET